MWNIDKANEYNNNRFKNKNGVNREEGEGRWEERLVEVNSILVD